MDVGRVVEIETLRVLMINRMPITLFVNLILRHVHLMQRNAQAHPHLIILNLFTLHFVIALVKHFRLA